MLELGPETVWEAFGLESAVATNLTDKSHVDKLLRPLTKRAPKEIDDFCLDPKCRKPGQACSPNCNPFNVLGSDFTLQCMHVLIDPFSKLIGEPCESFPDGVSIDQNSVDLVDWATSCIDSNSRPLDAHRFSLQLGVLKNDTVEYQVPFFVMKLEVIDPTDNTKCAILSIDNTKDRPVICLSEHTGKAECTCVLCNHLKKFGFSLESIEYHTVHTAQIEPLPFEELNSVDIEDLLNSPDNSQLSSIACSDNKQPLPSLYLQDASATQGTVSNRSTPEQMPVSLKCTSIKGGLNDDTAPKDVKQQTIRRLQQWKRRMNKHVDLRIQIELQKLEIDKELEKTDRSKQEIESNDKVIQLARVVQEWLFNMKEDINSKAKSHQTIKQKNSVKTKEFTEAIQTTEEKRRSLELRLQAVKRELDDTEANMAKFKRQKNEHLANEHKHNQECVTLTQTLDRLTEKVDFATRNTCIKQWASLQLVRSTLQETHKVNDLKTRLSHSVKELEEYPEDNVIC